ncbi:MAG TPA: hypothetical protein VGU01_03035 [Sphingomicrobium sp.]|nr:hypothetical protein [Sphingomicrobium sp.]
MYTNLDLCLVILIALYVGAVLGLMFGGMGRAAKAHDEAFGEHESDAPYPRTWE